MNKDELFAMGYNWSTIRQGLNEKTNHTKAATVLEQIMNYVDEAPKIGKVTLRQTIIDTWFNEDEEG